nr:exocyst complex component EXO70B1 [Ipomoea batatas]
MVAAGYGKECSHAYSTSRREFLEESLARLGIQKLSIDEVQKMQWAELEDEIERWMKAINVALRILFPSERRLCDRVFFGFSSAADLSFMEVCRGSTIQLLNFADAVAIGSRAPERLFKVLDVYETLRDLMPEFELIFSDQYCVFLRNEAVTIWKRLGEAIKRIFMELENLIRRDPAKAAVPGGGLHPITRYVMNYLRAACRSRLTLEQVFEESIAPTGVDYGREGDERAALALSSSSLAVQMAWIMELLESNLEAKSKVYRDSALSSIFMMNNARYIVQKVKDNELGTLLGDDWIRKHAAKVRQYHVNYKRSSWSKVQGVLKMDNSMSPSQASKTLKDKLKLFNSYFEEICKNQTTWVVFDEQLREELRISVTGTLSPAYRNFIGRVYNIPDFGKHTEKHIRYSVEDLEARINELFQGNGSRNENEMDSQPLSKEHAIQSTPEEQLPTGLPLIKRQRRRKRLFTDMISTAPSTAAVSGLRVRRPNPKTSTAYMYSEIDFAAGEEDLLKNPHRQKRVLDLVKEVDIEALIAISVGFQWTRSPKRKLRPMWCPKSAVTSKPITSSSTATFSHGGAPMSSFGSLRTTPWSQFEPNTKTTSTLLTTSFFTTVTSTLASLWRSKKPTLAGWRLEVYYNRCWRRDL